MLDLSKHYAPAPKPSQVEKPREKPSKAAIPKSRPNPVNRKRRAKEYARCFHSKERRKFVQSLPCCACGKMPTKYCPSDNHHIKSDGTGRKSAYTNIVPLCRVDHALVHSIGRTSFEEYHGIRLSRLARFTEVAWLEHQRSAA